MQTSFGTTALKQKKQELEKIQLEAARIATGATELVFIQKLSDDIGWEELEIPEDKKKKKKN